MTAPKFTVCLVNAKHSDGRCGDAYLGSDLQFSTLDPLQAHRFDQYEAERFADHWRGWYRGFHGGATIEVREQERFAFCPIRGLLEQS